jgi:hypothetical protein
LKAQQPTAPQPLPVETWEKQETTQQQTQPLQVETWDRGDHESPTLPPPPQEPKQSSPLDFFGQLIKDPLGTIGGALTLTSAAAQKVEHPVSTITQVYVGAAKTYYNVASQTEHELKQMVSGQPKIVPLIDAPFKSQTAPTILKPVGESEAFGMQAAAVGSAATVAVATPYIAPKLLPISAKAIVASGALSYGISEGVSYFTTKEFLPLEKKVQAFAVGEVFAVGFGGAQHAAITTTKALAPSLASSKIAMPLIKAGAVAPVGYVGGYVTSGGDKQAALVGAGLAFGASLGLDAARVGAGKLQTAASKKLTTSYDKHTLDVQKYFESTNYEMGANLKQYTLQYGEPLPGVWKPTLGEKALMTLTHAKPKAPASSIVSFDAPAEIMTPTGKQFIGGLSIKDLQAASGSFDLAFAPKSSLYVTSSGVIAKSTTSKTLPLYFGLGQDLIKVSDIKVESTPKEQGLPDSFLDYDYRGPLSFKRPQLFYGSGQSQYVTYQPAPVAKTVSKTAGMKPLWDSIGSKATTTPTISTAPLLVQTSQTVELEKSTPKTDTTTEQKQTVTTEPVLVANPFTQTKTKQQEEYDLTYIPMPGDIEKSHEKLISGEAVLIEPTIPIVTDGFSDPVDPILDSPIGFISKPEAIQQKSKQDIAAPVITPKYSHGGFSMVDVIPQLPITPGLTPGQNPLVSPSVKQVITPIPALLTPTAVTQITPQVPGLTTTPKIPPFVLPSVGKSPFVVPPFKLAGGHGAGRGARDPFGKWHTRKNPVKTYDDMLKTFGVRLQRKPLRPRDQRKGKTANPFGFVAKKPQPLKAFNNFSLSRRRRKR